MSAVGNSDKSISKIAVRYLGQEDSCARKSSPKQNGFEILQKVSMHHNSLGPIFTIIATIIMSNYIILQVVLVFKLSSQIDQVWSLFFFLTNYMSKFITMS